MGKTRRGDSKTGERCARYVRKNIQAAVSPIIAPQNVLSSAHDKLGLALQGTAWQELQNISVIREGEYIYPLRPRMDNVTHRLMCQIELRNNIKVITIRSTFQIQNDTSLPVEMVVVDGAGKNVGHIHSIRMSSPALSATLL